jgi:hypothetical protein
LQGLFAGGVLCPGFPGMLVSSLIVVSVRVVRMLAGVPALCGG